MTTPAFNQAVFQDIVTSFDLPKPQFMTKLFSKHGDQGIGHMLVMQSMGFSTPVQGQVFYHFEDEYTWVPFKVKTTVASPGLGNDIVLTLDPSSVNSDGAFFPRQNDQVMFKGQGNVVGYIYDIDDSGADPLLTIRVLDSADTFPTVEGGSELFISGNMFSEGSGQPLARMSGASKFTGYTQIIKETIGYSGSEMTQEDWVDIYDDGKKFLGWWDKVRQINLDYNFTRNMSGVLSYSKPVTNVNATDKSNGDRKMYATEGITNYALRVGQHFPYTPGTRTVWTYDQKERVLDKQHVPGKMLSYMGRDLDMEDENMLLGFLQNTQVNYTVKALAQEYFEGDEALAVSVGFTAFTKGSRTYMKRRWWEMSDSQQGGVDGYAFPSFGLDLPLGMKKVANATGGSEKLPYVGMRWRQSGPYSRKVEMWDVGGAGPGQKVTQYDRVDKYMRAEIGGHYIAGNMWLVNYSNAA